MDNKVILHLKNDTISLAGYEYGKQIYEAQVKDKIDINKEFYIEIPSNIQFVASSFVQGFFSEIIEKIGLYSTEQNAKILSKNSKLEKNFLSKLI